MGYVCRLRGRMFFHHSRGARQGVGGRLARRMSCAILLILLGIPSIRARAQAPQPGTPAESSVQLVQPPATDQAGAPITVTLQDALDRAQKNDATFLGVKADAEDAREDRVQARAALLPSVSTRFDYLGSEGGGLLQTGKFVTNDGVHVYRFWGVIHQDLSPTTYLGTGYRRAQAAEALAKAKLEIAQRGLNATVTKNYYALVVSQRKYATAQAALQQAQNFLNISEDTERAGQGAHSDVVKAQIQFENQTQAFEESRLAMEDARLSLAVILFPTLNENFTAVDDLDSPRPLPPFEEARAMAARENPDLQVAMQTQREAQIDVRAAKGAFLPSISVEPVYGIEANAFAVHSGVAAFNKDPANCSGATTPAEADALCNRQNNLGYFITASLTMPIFDWGTLRSKLHQAESKRERARVELSQTQRELVSNLYTAYNEAMVARAAVDRLRRTADLATESLRLVNLRYQGGASTVLDVVDAENTLTTARNAYDDAQVRYRVALAQLQTLTGNF
jgi:outer membrane protein TolC